METLVDLNCAQANGSRDSKHGGNHTWEREFHFEGSPPEYIHKVSNPAKDSISNKWKEAGLHGERQALPVGHQGQKETDDGIDGPAMKAPKYNLPQAPDKLTNGTV